MDEVTARLVRAYETSAARSTHSTTEERYRDKWRWDKVAWGTHCVDCYPAGCPMRVYVRDGKVVREEQAGSFPMRQQGVPDMNPFGCQKGVAWSQTLNAPDRLLHPLHRIGERGEGRWEEVSWDRALTGIADAMLDAIVEDGPEAIVQIGGPNASPWNIAALGRLFNFLGGLTTDVNAEINDFSPGIYLTFGKFNLCNSLDDGWHAQFTITFMCNPVYTVMSACHYGKEAWYNGAEGVIFAPDCSPSTMLADRHLPVRPGTDAAWALGACHVVIEEGLYDAPFVKEQTDLLLTGRNPRAPACFSYGPTVVFPSSS